ncbi:alanine--glyoxylate aminotransferase family protein [Aerococcaceae bacterium DSM 111022]|nr:alanine--glyoxylate aminotransferase family protein [Aerococcaceae bacterium DSM 111022]MBG9988637.1 alanine--glyoxylate aminotransferase family protein [Aerococcaceae bacterium DSM 111176]
MIKDFTIPQRTIMTPGPVEVHPKVLQAMSNRMLGQFDPAFLSIMEDNQELMRPLFGTEKGNTLAVNGTSRSGIEAALIGLIEPGDKILIPAYGRFAYLLSEIAERAKGDVILMEKEWDSPFDQEDIIQKIKEVEPKIVAMIHGETANGQMAPIDKVGHFCQENNIFFMVDCVATYGGVEFKMDEWGVNVAVAGTQKCVSVPTGLSLIAYDDKAKDFFMSRFQKEEGIRTENDEINDRHIQSNYLDISQIIRYWSNDKINHHTEVNALNYGLHTGLRMILEEGKEEVYARHQLNNDAIVAGIQAMGLNIFGNIDTKMNTVIPIIIPEGVNPNIVPEFLLNQFGVEIAGSFGPLIGKIWRIGNMGYSSRRENVLHVLAALEATLIHFNAPINKGEAVQAALGVYLNKVN